MRTIVGNELEHLPGGGETRNRVVLSLRPAAQEFLRTRLITKELKFGEVLFEDGAPCTHAIFPHAGVISLVSRMENGRRVQKTSVGNEGFLGFSQLLGGGSWMSLAVVCVPGYASWLGIADLNEALSEFLCVREAMLRYANALIAQLMESAACNSLHTADQRIARFLLQTRDRMIGDTFELTQQTISDALALRRATAGAVCSFLQKQGAIRYTRGSLTIVDRAKLQNSACECYRCIRAAELQ